MSGPKRQLGLFDGTAIIVGIVIGAGIYETTPIIAASLPGPAWLLPVWVGGAVIALLGALCYAEIITRLPRAGGDYAFLNEAYGPRTGFLFAWAEFWLMRPASIGAVAFVFARYANAVTGSEQSFVVAASIVVVVLTAVNLAGVKSGSGTQNVLAAIKLLALLGLGLVGLAWADPAPAAAVRPLISAEADLALAMILVLFTYGGWNSIAYVAAEVRDPQRNILRALVLGISVIAVLYLLVNIAFIRTLGFAGMGAADSIAADMLGLIFGDVGVVIISILICITCLGNINGMILTGSRIFYAAGRDHKGYEWLGRWHARRDAPVAALLMQMLISLALIITLGLDGRGFERLVIFSTPLFWAFFTLVAIALFILRYRDGLPHGYRVPLYPVLPLLFCLFCGGMFYVSLRYAIGREAPELFWVAVVMLTGIAVTVRQAKK